jgi:hypothetical protein
MKKEWLISHKNPTWEDLAGEWYTRTSICARETAGPCTRQLIGNANQLAWSG